MKKVMAMLMMIMMAVLAVFGSAMAEGSAWPTREMEGIETSLRPVQEESMRRQSSFGPSSEYPGAGAYKPYKATRVTALFQEGDYVLVDLSYTTVGRRCLYFKASSLTNANVETVSLEGHAARTTAEVNPKFGPGYEYNAVMKNVSTYVFDENEWEWTKVEYKNRVLLSAGTPVQVFFEANDWVFAEFSCILGVIRAWIPANQVSAD